jgi:hypothetical protein
MNRKQIICLWIGIGVIVLMGLFPPWFFAVDAYGAKMKKNKGYIFILTPPPHEFELTNRPVSVMSSIDFSRLCLQGAMVAVVTSGLIVTFKGEKPKDEQKE